MLSKFLQLFTVATALDLDPLPPGREKILYNVTFDGLGTGTGFIDTVYPNVVQLYGVPYAYPPINERRFRVPKLMDSWSGTLDFGTYKPMCLQFLFDAEVLAAEDCLYVNIYAPKDAIENPDAKYPVMVYFHGGLYFFGGNGWRDAHGTILAERQNMIFVSVGYRLGVFGFAHNSEFMNEDGVMGNWGSLDQRMAMLWVNKYIHNIGGDPTRVTLGGCSAGGQSTMVHLTSPDSWPYFSRIVDFSGPNGIPYKNISEAETLNTEFFRRAGCCKESTCKLADIECLRSKTVTEIQRAAWGLFVLELDVCRFQLKNSDTKLKFVGSAEGYTIWRIVLSRN